MGAVEELVGNASDSEASAFHGFKEAKLEDILLRNRDDDDDVTGSWYQDIMRSCVQKQTNKQKNIFWFNTEGLKPQTGLQWLNVKTPTPETVTWI